jgi:hypothetical protein
LVLALGAGHGLLAILHSTALGYPQPEEWSRFDFGEWFGQALYLVSGFVLSILPVVLLGSWIPLPWRLLLGAAFSWLSFPVILLSMFDADSPAVPYTAHVGRTWWSGGAAWRKFYLSTGGLWLVTAGCLTVAALVGRWGLLPAAAAAVIAMTVYFRLLGRLAWVLDQLPCPEEEDDGGEPPPR